jgi:prepilin-type N-terminal cleavage/methylation domain-containing protein
MTHRSNRKGVTLIEMLVVVTIIGLLLAVVAPSFGSGIDSIRLNGAADSLVAFLNAAQNASEGRQTVVEVSIERAERRIITRSNSSVFNRTYQLPEGVSIAEVRPAVANLPPDQPYRFLLLPGSGMPRINVVLENARGGALQVMMDPINGNPRIEKGKPEPELAR